MFSQGTVINLTTDDTCGDKFTVTTADALQLSWQGWLYALLPGSAAIDAGYSTYCPATDQRGVPRPRDGNGDGTAECDIGSYEALWMSHRVYLPLAQRQRLIPAVMAPSATYRGTPRVSTNPWVCQEDAMKRIGVLLSRKTFEENDQQRKRSVR
jgi:hypothetical protein